jgi:hypothetical protein
MTTTALAALIAATCSFSSPHATQEFKLGCGERLVNCAVIKDGIIDPKIVNKCLNKELNK